MANDTAWQEGWQIGKERMDERRAHKQALSDAQFQEKHNEIQGMVNNLNSQLAAVPEDARNTPDYLKLKDQLAQTLQDRDAHWKSLDHPNAILKFGKMLGKDLRFGKGKDSTPVAPPVYGQPTMEVDGEKVPTGPAYKVQGPQTPAQVRSAAEASQLVAAAPLSPDQQATQQANSTAAGTLASIQASLKNFDKLNPDATEEERDSFRNTLIQRSLIGQEKPTLKLYTLPDGTKAWLDASRPDLIPPGSSAAVTETPNTLQMSQYNEDVKNGKFKGSYPEWLKKQRGGTGIKYEAATGQVVDPVSGIRYSEGQPNNPPEVAKLFKSIGDMTSKKQAFQLKLAAIRGSQYNLTKPMVIYDTANGNAPGVATYADMLKQPGRFVPAGAADKALAKENLMQDIAGTSRLTRDAIVGMKEDFPEDMKVKITLAMKADDPHAAIDQLIASGAIGSLAPDQQDFLISTRQLAENAMAMRTILGAGQGSEDMRNAIRDTLPGLLSPDKSYALRQLDAFDKTINRLHRGVPKVQLRTDLGDETGNQFGGSSAGDTMITMKLKDGRTGKIHKSQKDKFVRDNPGSTEVTGAR